MKSKRAREAAVAAIQDTEEQSPQPTAARKRKHTDLDGATEAAAARKKTKKVKDSKKKLKESRREKKDKQRDLTDLPEDDGVGEKEEKLMENGGVMEEAEEEEKREKKEKKGEKGEKRKKGKKEKKKKKHADMVDDDTDQELRQGEKKRKKNAESTKTERAKKNTTSKESAKEESQEKERVSRVEISDDQSQNIKSDKLKRLGSEEKKKAEKKGKGSNGTTLTSSDPTTGNANDASKNRPDNGEDGIAAVQAKADRHIVFVGNLPYTATPETLQAHFASLEPVAVRCLTERGNAKPCRGIAFVEFASARAQRTCLDRFHHSLFDDGKSPARKINVELTAGGGGKTSHRKDKIREKNKALEENRSKHIEKEKTAKEKKGEGEDEAQQQKQQQVMGDSIHPSRLARNPRLGQ